MFTHEPREQRHTSGTAMSEQTKDLPWTALSDEERERPRREPRGCACFAPGEASGSCPGQTACPMCQDDEPESDYCECQAAHTINEEEDNRCDCCGKEIA